MLGMLYSMPELRTLTQSRRKEMCFDEHNSFDLALRFRIGNIGSGSLPGRFSWHIRNAHEYKRHGYRSGNIHSLRLR